jgi:hypothetical protein
LYLAIFLSRRNYEMNTHMTQQYSRLLCFINRFCCISFVIASLNIVNIHQETETRTEEIKCGVWAHCQEKSRQNRVEQNGTHLTINFRRM